MTVADSGNVLTTLITGGLGATLGGIVTAVLQVAGKRGESKATAADLVSKAAGTIVTRLDAENRNLREAILLLIEVLDEVAPALHSDVAKKLNDARRAAERAIL